MSSQDVQARRLAAICSHLSASPCSAADSILPVPVVQGTELLSTNPLEFLMASYKDHPDIFMVDRGRNNKYVVVGDVSLFDEVLSDEAVIASMESLSF
jgi:hypothetical protein